MLTGASRGSHSSSTSRPCGKLKSLTAHAAVCPVEADNETGHSTGATRWSDLKKTLRSFVAPLVSANVPIVIGMETFPSVFFFSSLKARNQSTRGFPQTAQS